MIPLRDLAPSIEAALPHIFLPSKSLCCSPEPMVVTTVLGSCVAVCLWDRVRARGAMNHYLLPQGGAGDRSLRYGMASIDQLVEGMVALGCRTATLEAKIFGGATVLSFGDPHNNVGTKNVAAAVERLKHHGIPIKAQRTGGTSGLWIQLSTNTGDVLTRSLGA